MNPLIELWVSISIINQLKDALHIEANVRRH